MPAVRAALTIVLIGLGAGGGVGFLAGVAVAPDCPNGDCLDYIAYAAYGLLIGVGAGTLVGALVAAWLLTRRKNANRA